MNKNTKTLLGVAVIAGLGYFLYTKYGKKPVTSGFANAIGELDSCRCHCFQTTSPSGDTVFQCGNGRDISFKSDKPCAPGVCPPSGPQGKQRRIM